MNRTHQSALRQRGVSMIELMVSVVIGMFVVGAVLVSYLGSGGTSRLQGSVSQMSEDAQIAFGLMSRDLQMAGYSDISGTTSSTSTTATFEKLYTGPATFGCSTQFTSPTAAFNSAACVVGGSTATHSIEVNYQATSLNTIPNSGGAPTDCLGNGLSLTSTFYVATNRYYVTTTAGSLRPELHCASASGSAQPLVENVQAMKVWYGEAVAASPKRAVRYVTASSVTDWSYVVSARICLLMRSVEPVLSNEDSLTYTDCDGATQTSSDKRLYRAFFTTVAIRNRVGFS